MPVKAVTVFPSVTFVAGGQTEQFAAVVSGSEVPSQGVVWGASAGTITPDGLWTAPPAAPAPRVVTITAASAASPSVIGSAVGRVSGIAAPPAEPVPPPTVPTTSTARNWVQRFYARAESHGIPVTLGVDLGQDGAAVGGVVYKAVVQDATGQEGGTIALDQGTLGVFIAAARPKVFRLPAVHFRPYADVMPPTEGILAVHQGWLYRVAAPDVSLTGEGHYSVDLYAYRYIDRPRALGGLL